MVVWWGCPVSWRLHHLDWTDRFRAVHKRGPVGGFSTRVFVCIARVLVTRALVRRGRHFIMKWFFAFLLVVLHLTFTNADEYTHKVGTTLVATTIPKTHFHVSGTISLTAGTMTVFSVQSQTYSNSITILILYHSGSTRLGPSETLKKLTNTIPFPSAVLRSGMKNQKVWEKLSQDSSWLKARWRSSSRKTFKRQRFACTCLSLILPHNNRATLTSKDAQDFVHAVKNQYWFEFFLDDLPIWGWIGEVSEEDKVYVYSTHEVTIKYNTDQVTTNLFLLWLAWDYRSPHRRTRPCWGFCRNKSWIFLLCEMGTYLWTFRRKIRYLLGQWLLRAPSKINHEPFN